MGAKAIAAFVVVSLVCTEYEEYAKSRGPLHVVTKQYR